MKLPVTSIQHHHMLLWALSTWHAEQNRSDDRVLLWEVNLLKFAVFLQQTWSWNWGSPCNWLEWNLNMVEYSRYPMDGWKWTQDQWRLDLWLASMKDLHKYMLLAFDECPNKCKEGLTTNAPMFHKKNHYHHKHVRQKKKNEKKKHTPWAQGGRVFWRSGEFPACFS